MASLRRGRRAARRRRGLLAGAALLLASAVRADPYAYVTDQGSDDVAVIDLASGRRAATLRTGHAPVGVAILADPARVFITNPESHDLTVIERGAHPEEDRVLASVPAGLTPIGIEADARSGRVYVTDMSANRLIAFDARSLQQLGSAAVGRGPGGLAVDPAAGRIYVANRDEDSVTVVDARRLAPVATYATGAHPFGVALDAPHRRLYVANVEGNSVSVLSLDQGARVVPDIAVGSAPYCLAVNDVLQRLYVSNQHSDSVSVIDTEGLRTVATVETGGYPEGVALTADGRGLWVVNWMDNTLSEHDPVSGRLLRAIAGGKNNRGFGRFVAPPAAAPAAVHNPTTGP